MTSKAIGEAGDLFLDLAEEAAKRKWFQRAFALMKAKPRILVLGQSGTGKSNFVESLRRDLPKAIDRMSRTEYAGAITESCGS
jgi:putative ribosome biogenesis GTPase RsgA